MSTPPPGPGSFPRPDDAPQQDVDPLRSGLARLAHSWGWYIFFGVVGILAGILALVLPGTTVGVLATLFGVWLVVVGVFRLISAIAFRGLSGGTRALFAIVGVLTLVVGFLAIRYLDLTAISLGVLLGVIWLVQGIVELLAGIDSAGAPGRGWTIANGILGIVTGAILLIIPGISLLVLGIITGIYLLAFGAFQIAIALGLRKLGKAV